MDKITKKINLSCFERDAETGRYLPDFVIEGTTITENPELLDGHLPYVTVHEDDEDVRVMRRCDVSGYLQWLKDVIRNGELYQLCVRKMGQRGVRLVWIKLGYEEKHLQCGDAMRDILRLFDEDIIDSVFVEPYLEDIPENPEDSESEEYSGHTVGDIVFLTPFAEEFEHRFINPAYAKVFYCFAVYALNDPDTCEELACEMQADMEPSQPYASTHVFLEEAIEDMGDLYPVGEYTFCGNYDPDVTYEPYSVVWKNGALSVFTGTEWIEIGDIYPVGPENPYDGVETVRVPSTLASLKRIRKSVDLHGDPLPFYIDTSNPDAAPYDYPFAIGAMMNVRESDGGFYFDRVEKAEFIKYEEDEDGNDVEVASTREDGTYIKFTYTTGNYYDIESDTENRGLVMSEAHPYRIAEGRYSVYSEAGEDYSYLEIDFDSVRQEDLERGQFAEARFAPGVFLPEFANKTELIRYEGTLGMHDVDKSGDRIFVERGRSAFFEPFNILGEVNSVEDIENYRDDYFRIRGKND